MGRRAAQLWKTQEALTDGPTNEKLSVEELLRVKIALKVMRKTHTKTEKSEAERRRRKQKGVAHEGDGDHGHHNYSSVQDDTVQIRSLDDIMKEARNNFNLTKDKRKMDKASVKYGQLRPIFPHLVQEIILEQEELRRIRDERDENEVDSMGSVDEFGKRLSRPSRAIANAQKRKESKRPHSAAAMGRKHASITAAQKMLTSKEAPGRMSRSSMAQADGGGAGSGGEGEGTDRRRLLSKASLATVDALQDSTVPGYRRQELVPIRSSEVFLMNAEGGPATGGDQQGKTGRLQKELQQHIQNAQVLADTNGPAGPSAGVGADFGPSVGSMKAKMSSSGKHQQQRGGAFGSMSSGLDVLHEHEERTVGSGDGGSVHLSKDDPQDAAERTAALLFRSTSARSPSPSTSERCLSPSQMMLRQNSGGNNLGLEEFNSSTTGRPLVLLRQLSATKNSPFFSTSSVKDDGRIARAQQQKEDIQKQKEEDLRQRIRNKELASLSKAEMLLHEQRQRAWAVAVVTLARWSILSTTLTKKRSQQDLWGAKEATIRAIALIERWWRRGRVRMMFKRHPHIVPLIRRVIMPLVVRTRLRRKRRSADLLITFLRDSTGMSETVRAIHAFRKTVLRVQRWMKAWIASKHCRLRVLWLKCERMYRERLRAEGADGKTSTAVAAASSRVNMFAGTVDELGAKRKQLARLLEDQENARLARLDEARYQQEIIEKKQKAEEDRIARYRKLKHLKKAEIKAQEKARSNVAKKASGGGGGGLFSPSVDSTAAASSAAVSTMSSLPGYLMQKGAVKRAQLPWHKRIRNSASNIKIYDQLEEVLKYERRRHMVNLFKVKRKGDECLVAPYELRRFLKNPNGYDGVNEISKKLSEVQVISDSKAKMYKTPFLLLTQGGIGSLEMLLSTNRYIKF